MKKIIVNESQIKKIIVEMIRPKIAINEIRSDDAYKKFYSDKFTEEQYGKIMAGSANMTPLHKYALDLMTAMDVWDETVATLVPRVWSKGQDARAYAIDMLPDKSPLSLSSSSLKWARTQFVNLLVKVSHMTAHSESGFASHGLYKMFENDSVLVTCTLTYSASKKYYGGSHWCTASDIGGEYNGWKMFMQYTGNSDNEWDDVGPSMLMQVVNKKDNTKTFQAQVGDDDGEFTIGDVCWFNGQTASAKDIAQALTDIGFPPSDKYDGEVYGDNEKLLYGFLNDISCIQDVGRLINTTKEFCDEEFEYWNKRTNEYHKKKRETILSHIQTSYDAAIINALQLYSTEYISSDEDISFELRRMYEKNNLVTVFITFNGINEQEKNYIVSCVENGDIPEEFGQATWVVEYKGNNPHVVTKVMCSYPPKIYGKYNVALADDYNDYRTNSTCTLIDISTGEILLKGVRPIKNIGNLEYVITTGENGNPILLVEDGKYSEDGPIYIGGYDLVEKKYLGRIDTSGFDTRLFYGGARIPNGNGR